MSDDLTPEDMAALNDAINQPARDDTLFRQQGSEALEEWHTATASGDEIEIEDAGTRLAEFVAELLGIEAE